MLIKPNVEELLDKSANRYELIMAVSKRARQIVEGDKPKVETKEKSPVTISALEFNQEKFAVVKEEGKGKKDE
jgi:DNA-directed RNA polymerase subunit omega